MPSSVLVMRCWGRDKPGISSAFVKIIAENDCVLMDMAQFVLGDSLMFSLVIRVPDKTSMRVTRHLSRSAKELDLQLDFHFPDNSCCQAESRSGKEASVELVSSEAITIALLVELDAVLLANSCSLVEIRNRKDNKRVFNADYNKVQLHVSCPEGFMLSTLLFGGSHGPGLQEVAWKHSAEVTARWWDALSRPGGRSLVVFGLTDVLCPYCVLDEVVKEAGMDVSKVSKAEDKVKMLAGKSCDAVQKFIDRIEITPGARLVCGLFKRLGFRMAILTNTGMREVADHVKNLLGIDYAISKDLEVVDGVFTGRYAGETSDIVFRKADILRLMADKENLAYRSVIVVGEFLQGLKLASAREALDTFGPNVWFNAAKLKDLTIVLYLLGFDGKDVCMLRKRRLEDVGNLDTSVKRVRVQLGSRERKPGQMQQLFSALKARGTNVEAETVRQRSLQDGGICLGVDLSVQGAASSEDILREIVFSSVKRGFSVLDMVDSENALAHKVGHFGLRSSDAATFDRRYVVTLVEKPHIKARNFEALVSTIAHHNINIAHMERLSADKLAAMQFVVLLPDGMEPSTLSTALAKVSTEHGADIAFQKDDLDRWMRRLVVFDMDSTLIQQEVIDELARMAGVEKAVSTITEAAMRGEIDFFESLKQRVALLKGHNAERLFSAVKSNLVYTPGAKKLCSTLKHLGFKMAVISGGFIPVAREVQRYLGLDYAFANTLEVDDHGNFTGFTSGPVVTPQRKRNLLATIASVEGCDVSQTIAVGDGSNDIPMLNTAGLGIAFCAKPKVQKATDFRINQKDLSTVLYLIGVSENAANRLVGEAELDE